MSLGGIAIAIGAMVDAAIVMIENAHKKLEAWRHEHAALAASNGGRVPEPTSDQRWKLIVDASVEVGPALFFSLLIITLSFVPVFALEAQAGRMFKPARVHEDLRDGRRGGARDHAGAGADGLC